MVNNRAAEITAEHQQIFQAIVSSLSPTDERPLLAVDGVDGSGKSIFADALAEYFRSMNRRAIRISADDFHQPKAIRYRRGKSSAAGFWLDSYDYPRLKHDVLEPLSANGNGTYKHAGHDLESDKNLSPEPSYAPFGAVTVLDGMFLHRDGLTHYWSSSVFLDVPFTITAIRMSSRDGTCPDPSDVNLKRYVHGQRMYFDACDPAARADLIIDNSAPASPRAINIDHVSYHR